jgi:hypothetical protein
VRAVVHSQEHGEYAATSETTSKRCLQLPVEMLYNQWRRVTMGWNSSDAICHNRIDEFSESADVVLMRMPFDRMVDRGRQE